MEVNNELTSCSAIWPDTRAGSLWPSDIIIHVVLMTTTMKEAMK